MSSRGALLIGNIDHCKTEWDNFSSIVSLHQYGQGNRDEFIANCKSGKYDGVVAIYRSNESTKVTGPFDAELLDALPKSLEFICHNGAGYDNIDIATCTKKGIRVSSTPVAVAPATADVAIFLMIGALRQLWTPLSAVRAGEWRGETVLGNDPQGKVLGILGMGGIGKEVAHRAKAFGMKVIYHNRKRADPEPEGTEYVTFDALLSRSDVISINCTLTDQTRHIIREREFAKMKTGVVIVNTARGAVIDEKALVEALGTKVASVGLDVYEHEPKIEPVLREHPRAFLLPHIGTFTRETQKKMEELVLRNLRSCLEHDILITMVPEQRMVFP
ncbi:D-3-phosphoglycerate dehydrogenase [Blastomyces gilchristii SLH14081]|uniref:D-3-phosphoglycerate dehydrogenase n=1 Tax=Blastomyces gilchristii (strain SLH14081) TaxID=559298 RepID=A0A179UVY4_BLAGS|nr:D-3-phosphoglycerate dehydrogenase [Blastomyces gilchristii SLH14081]OAT10562.1 D-3-phosphoglycerate dehydrogenase [Blastomyces gilchristii SLH14081]